MTDRVLTEGRAGKVNVQGIKDVKTAATTVLGDIKALSQGREVMYCKVGATALAIGVPVQGPALVAAHQSAWVTVTASVGEKGPIQLSIGATSMTKDQYKDGWFVVTCGIGTGYVYMIERNLSAAASSTAAKIWLKDGLEVALTTASQVQLVPNIANGVIVQPASNFTSTFLGVSIISAAANSYCWIGHKGPWLGVVGSGEITAGSMVYPSCAGASFDGDAWSGALTGKICCGIAITSAAASSGSFALIDIGRCG